MSSNTCWADPLSRAERRVLRVKLAHACNKSFRIREDDIRMPFPHFPLWIEMSDLHLDVTERAEVPAA